MTYEDVILNSLRRMSEPQSTIETDKSFSGTRETRKIEIVLIKQQANISININEHLSR